MTIPKTWLALLVLASAATTACTRSPRPCAGPGENVVIKTPAAWRALVDSECTTISGDLDISGADLAGPLVAPRLDSIVGSISMQARAATELKLPSLSTVGGSIVIDSSAALVAVDFPTLKSIGVGMKVTGNPLLSSLSLPALATIHKGNLVIESNRALPAIDLPRLTTVDTLWISWNGLVTSINAPALTVVKTDLHISHSSRLPSVSMPVLATIGRQLTIHINDSMTTLSLPALASLGSLFVTHNDRLPTCRAVAIKKRLELNGWAGPSTIAINSPACPQ